MVRHLLYAAFVHLYFQALQKSNDTRLAEIAAHRMPEFDLGLRLGAADRQPERERRNGSQSCHPH